MVLIEPSPNRPRGYAIALAVVVQIGFLLRFHLVQVQILIDPDHQGPAYTRDEYAIEMIGIVGLGHRCVQMWFRISGFVEVGPGVVGRCHA